MVVLARTHAAGVADEQPRDEDERAVGAGPEVVRAGDADGEDDVLDVKQVDDRGVSGDGRVDLQQGLPHVVHEEVVVAAERRESDAVAARKAAQGRDVALEGAGGEALPHPCGHVRDDVVDVEPDVRALDGAGVAVRGGEECGVPTNYRRVARLRGYLARVGERAPSRITSFGSFVSREALR